MEPVGVVEAQLQSLQYGEDGLRAAHAFMSPAYHERSDALERFSLWFSSPMYETLLGCAAWDVRGSVSMRDETSEVTLPDGRVFLGTKSVEQVVKVDVKAGRPKWAESGATGVRIGRALATGSFLWTLSWQADSERWTVDQIVPEAPPRLTELQRLRGGALHPHGSKVTQGRHVAWRCRVIAEGGAGPSHGRRLAIFGGGATAALATLATVRYATVDSFPLSWEGPIRSYESYASMSGKTVLITGGNAGIGFETAARLAEEGASIVLAGRSPVRMLDAAERIRARARASGIEQPDIQTSPLDLSSLASVRAFAAAFRSSHSQLDVLILNAGVSSLPKRTLTEDGMETQFQVNFLSHFLLANLLMPSLRAAAAPRIISVASIASYLPTAAIQLDDLQRATTLGYGTCTTPVDCFAYHQSKLAQLFFTRELQRRLGGARSRATVVSVHPGLVATPVLFGGLWELAGRLLPIELATDADDDGEAARRLQLLTGLKTPMQGAQTSIFAATAPEVTAARYGGHFLREVSDAEDEARRFAPGYGTIGHAGSEELGRALWRSAERLSGETFEPAEML